MNMDLLYTCIRRLLKMSIKPWSTLPNELLQRIFSGLPLADLASVRATCKDGLHSVNVHASKIRLRASTAGLVAISLASATPSELTLTVDGDENTDWSPLMSMLSTHAKTTFERVGRLTVELNQSPGAHGAPIIRAAAAMPSLTELIVDGWHPLPPAAPETSETSDDALDNKIFTFDEDGNGYDYDPVYDTTSPLPDLPPSIQSLVVRASTGVYLPLPWFGSALRRVCLQGVKDAWFAYSLLSPMSSGWSVEELTVTDCTFSMLRTALDVGYDPSPDSSSNSSPNQYDEFNNVRIPKDVPIMSIFEMMPWYTCRHVKFVNASLVQDAEDRYAYLPSELKYMFTSDVKLHGRMETLHVEGSGDVLQVVMHHPELLEGVRSLTLHYDNSEGRGTVEDENGFYTFTWRGHWEIAGKTLQHLTLVGPFCHKDDSMKHLDRLLTLSWNIDYFEWFEMGRNVLKCLVSLESLTLTVDVFDVVDDDMIPYLENDLREICTTRLTHLKHRDIRVVTSIHQVYQVSFL